MYAVDSVFLVGMVLLFLAFALIGALLLAWVLK